MMFLAGIYLAVLLSAVNLANSSVEIISVVDKAAATACIIKIFSILESAESKQSLSFRFVVFESDEFTTERWNRGLGKIFPTITHESKAWQRPKSFPSLSGDGFAKEEVFARFYLPSFFPTLQRFVFLDNDIIVTCDLYHLHSHRLHTSEEIPGSHEATPSPVNPRSIGRVAERPAAVTKQKVGNPAAVAFVYERHPGYKDYLHAHFQVTHPLVSSAIKARGFDVFLNGGVFVVDTARWVREGFTQQMEDLMKMNANHTLFNTEAVGDQGPFLLLYGNATAYLAPKYNMRRQPKKTINLLSTGTTGIVHFAGTTHADAEHLCRHPLQYPMLLTGAVPLYLSVVHALQRKYPAFQESEFRISTNSCTTAIPTVVAELARLNLRATYNPGAGGFTWPPMR